MHRITRFTLGLTLLAPVALSAQELPTTQPRYLTIIAEEIKPGHEAAHTENEKGWPAAFGQAGYTSYYLAFESLTGSSHVWFVSPYESYAAEGADRKAIADNATLSAELDRLWARDAEHLVSAKTVQAVARPDLSRGEFPDLPRMRYWEITTMTVKPGHEEEFAEAAKMYGRIAERGAPDARWRVYQIVAGEEGAKFIIFTSFPEYAGLDAMMAGGDQMMAKATAEEMAAMQRFGRESLVSAVTNRYRLSPQMSYVDAATRATDPAFWSGK